MMSSKTSSPSGGLDLELLHVILRMTRSRRLQSIIRDLLCIPPRMH